ncbi:hypothetical protein [Streptomyces longispororuber]|uniref:hypothetical protein n=1 Tax=Streptomyces longispororuber TaxID=68230 RepID=UPI00210C30C6|nr:hypothetical protein [Streptomyces longispororuber]MCQ4207778.1 hypothetical protein [Streptomyces longispororuber]
MLLAMASLVIGGTAPVSRCGGPTAFHRPCRRRRRGLFARCRDRTFTLVTITDLAGLALFGLAGGMLALFGPAV